MERWAGKVAIVTGASSGIGAAIVKNLAQSGLKVVGLARRANLIEELELSITDAPGEIFAYGCDVSAEDKILEAFAWVTENVGPVAIMVNNAGLLNPSTSLVEGDSEDWRKIFEINVMALNICTRESIKIMREHGINGHIIHINSVVGHRVVNVPLVSNVYCASKFAVTALAESLRHEFKAQNIPIKITSLSPGMVRTEIGKDIQDEELKEMLMQAPGLQPEDVAAAVNYVLATPPHVQIQELTIAALGEI